MGVAMLAGDFNPAHAVTAVILLVNAVGIQGVPKAGPATAGMKFGFGRKQRMSATDAMINACCGAVGILAGKGGFSAFFPADMELFRAEFLLPVLISIVLSGHRELRSECKSIIVRLQQFQFKNTVGNGRRNFLFAGVRKF